MILHYFKSKQNKENIIAKDIYNQLISINKLIVSRGILFNKNYFNLAFEINTLLLFCFFFGCKYNDNKVNKKICQELMNLFINDLDNSFRVNGIGDMSIGKYVKKTVNKFYFRVKKLEKIFEDNSIEQFKNYMINLKTLDISESNEKNVNYLFKNCKKLIVRSEKNEINKSILNKLFI